MNNLKKVGLTALAGALVSVSANAADLSVTGGASIGFAGEEEQDTGNGWSMNDGLTFSATTELDNGMTITAKQIIDSSDGTGGAIMDTRILTVDMGDNGVFTFSGTGGSSVLGMIDDTTPTAYEESWNFSGGPGTGTTTGNNAWKYSYGGVDGLNIEASYVPSTGTAANGSTDAGITYSGIDGLTVGIAMGTDDTGGSAAAVDEQAMYVTYAYDAFTFGVQSNSSDSATAGADSEFSGYAVSYAVSDDISVSLAQTEIGREGTSTLLDETSEHTAISASYTMGSMALKATRADVSNAGGNQDRDGEGYAVELSFAF